MIIRKIEGTWEIHLEKNEEFEGYHADNGDLKILDIDCVSDEK